jgi:flagellar biosynthesis protein FlhF
MKIKRYFATSMREAMRQVREDQGPDAVILGSEARDEGIELIAAVDYDAALLRHAMMPVAKAAAAAEPAAAEAEVEAPPPQRAPSVQKQKVIWAQDPHMARLQSEMRDLRGMLESTLSRQADAALRGSPVRRAALDSLDRLGLDSALAREIVAEMPDATDPAKVRALPLGLLARRIEVCGREPLHSGRVLALVGPTGAGKTTTVAKLAARAVAEFGARGVAVISTDDHRAGAEAQLGVYARLLGIPMLSAHSPEGIRRHLDTLADYRCVLIDTAGVSPADERLRALMPALVDLGPEVQRLLVLPAGLQREDHLANMSRFAAARPQGVVLSKVDECSRLGSALSALIGRRLPLAYVCDGQRVPEDLHVARAADLVVRAVALARAASAARLEVSHG